MHFHTYGTVMTAKWSKVNNETMALHLDLWLDLDGRVQSESQVEFFKELVWRLRMSDWNIETENNHE